jgi:hypothetical protein
MIEIYILLLNKMNARPKRYLKETPLYKNNSFLEFNFDEPLTD